MEMEGTTIMEVIFDDKTGYGGVRIDDMLLRNYLKKHGELGKREIINQVKALQKWVEKTIV